MLKFLSKKSRYCDGISRRSFLQVGALGGLGRERRPRGLRQEEE